MLLLLLLGLRLLGDWSDRGVVVLARGLLLQGVGLDPLGVRHHLLMGVSRRAWYASAHTRGAMAVVRISESARFTLELKTCQRKPRTTQTRTGERLARIWWEMMRQHSGSGQRYRAWEWLVPLRGMRPGKGIRATSNPERQE